MAQTVVKLTIPLSEILARLDLTPEELEFARGLKLGPYHVALPSDGLASRGFFTVDIEIPERGQPQ